MDSKKIILLIEDDKSLQKILHEKLESEGFQVDVVSNGKDGIAYLESHEGSVDLALVDILMPEMDGLTMIQLMNEKHIDTPVIILSNLSDSEKVSEALGKGVLDYMIKTDWTLDDIAKKVKEKLS